VTEIKPEVTILLVEDDDVDAMAIERALKKLPARTRLIRAINGEEALRFLRGGSASSTLTSDDNEKEMVAPFLVLLDLNMPRMGGIEFLEHVRDDVALKNTVIFVLTTSNAEADLTAAYDKNVAGYVLKSNARSSTDAIVAMLNQYWMYVELPK